jgi:hypothetical protein
MSESFERKDFSQKFSEGLAKSLAWESDAVPLELPAAGFAGTGSGTAFCLVLVTRAGRGTSVASSVTTGRLQKFKKD